MSIGEYLRAYRREHNLTKGELAAKLRSKLRTIEDWEAERRSPPCMLPLALAAASLELAPWAPGQTLAKGSTPEQLKSSVNWLFCQMAQAKAADFDDAFSRCVPADALPSEALLFAYLLNGSDGYNRIEAVEDWSERSRPDNSPVICFKPDLEGIIPTMAIECKWESETRTLAIYVESRRPGERSAEKLRIENSLVARGVRVISFVETEIFHDPDDCQVRVSNNMYDLTEDCLVKLGYVSPRLSQHE